MLVIPAINIKNGVCVSVKSSQIDDAKTYSDDLADTVGRWFDQGVERLHLVDLDGALKENPVNENIIEEISVYLGIESEKVRRNNFYQKKNNNIN